VKPLPYIEILKAHVDPPDRYFWRVRWGNGRVALTSELYNSRSACTKQVHRFSAITGIKVGTTIPR